MRAAVAALLADQPLVARLALVVQAAAPRGSCATPDCAKDHPVGRRFCVPCRDERDLERRRRWWAENRGKAA